jgi:hypothetical protein
LDRTFSGEAELGAVRVLGLLDEDVSSAAVTEDCIGIRPCVDVTARMGVSDESDERAM